MFLCIILVFIYVSCFLLTDGKLFSATVADFWARDPLIMESSGLKIRTEQHDSNMLNGEPISFVVTRSIYRQLSGLLRS